MKRISIWLLATVFAVACSEAPNDQADTADNKEKPAEEAQTASNESEEAEEGEAKAVVVKETAEGKFYGSEFEPANAEPANALASKVEKNGLMEGVKMTGTIGKSCQVNGCWMNVDRGGEPMRVTFKDYSFFIPKGDLSGREVVLEGKAELETTSVEDLKHFAEDEGKSEEEIAQITEPKTEVVFEATGVYIKN